MASSDWQTSINDRFDRLCSQFEKEFAELEKDVTSQTEYIPQGETTEAAVYKPTPIEELRHIGPKKLTIEEYRARQNKRKPTDAVVTPPVKRKRRGGKQVKLRRQRKELHRLIAITSGEEQKTLFKKLRQLQ